MVGSQLIPNNFVHVKVPCMLCPPTPAFSTHPQISRVKMWGSGSAHYFIALLPHVTRLYQYQCPGKFWLFQKTAWFFKRLRSGEPPVLCISKPWKNCQVSKKNRWLFDWFKFILWTMGYTFKMGILYFWELWLWTLKTAMIPSQGLCSL